MIHSPKRLMKFFFTLLAGTSFAMATAELPPLNPETKRAAFTAISPLSVAQSGQPIAGTEKPGCVVLSNEPGGKAGAIIEYDLQSLTDTITPLARIQLGEVEKLTVKRPGQKASPERAIMQVFYELDGEWKPAGSLPTKAGGSINTYTIDVTPAINAALARPKDQRKISLDLRMEGKPLFYEVYAVSQKPGPILEVASSKGWVDDWEKRVEPITTAKEIYRESCLPITETKEKDLTIRLLYPAKKVTEVIHEATGETYQEGKDWILRDGKVVLPLGSRVPIQTAEEFYTDVKKDKDGNEKRTKTSVRLVPETWYHERQIAVSYEPASRDWSFSPAISKIDQLPRIKALLEEKRPVRVVLFGDSISAGGDCSSLHGIPPFQSNYGELVAKQLAKHYGSEVTFINPSRPGATSAYGLSQAEAQVGGFKPDLAIIAYGMNDRAPERRAIYKANLEGILDAIRKDSPETEFIVVTPMLNNPKQPTGLDPVKFIRDEALKVQRPGTAFADVTTTELDMINHKDYLDLSGNGANHPNDFLHRIYAQRILEVLIPAKP